MKESEDKKKLKENEEEKVSGGRFSLGEGQARIEALAKGARVLSGKRFSARASEGELKGWIDSLHLG